MITPDFYPTHKQLRQFAVAALFGFALIGYMFFYHGAITTGFKVCAGLGMVIFALGMIAPESIRIVYALLILITLPIGWLISNILLRVIFYLVFTPIGMVFKLTGRDPLRLQKPSAGSYWLEHPERTDPKSYFRQA